MAFTYIPTSMPGIGANYALNPNPRFNLPSPSVGLPTGWQNWNNGAGAINGVDAGGVWNSAIAGGAAADGGIESLLGPTAPAPFPGLGWYVLEATVYISSGALTGAGVLAQFDDAAYATQLEYGLIDFTIDLDSSGVAPGAGTPGATYAFKKLVQVANPGSVACILYAMSHWDGFGHSIAAANLLDWYQCSIRPATLAEIAAGNGQYGLPVFPLLPGQSITLGKAPRWSTKVKRAASGRERRTALWPYPLWQFELSHEVVRHRPSNDELAALWSFFNTSQGQYQPWLFLDPSDYQQASPQVFATGDGSTATFQIGRTFTQAEPEPVYAPFGMTVFINGTATTAYTMAANGKITFSGPPAAGAVLTWTGCYYFGCRFLADDLTFEQLVSQLWSGKSVKFTSLRV